MTRITRYKSNGVEYAEVEHDDGTVTTVRASPIKGPRSFLSTYNEQEIAREEMSDDAFDNLPDGLVPVDMFIRRNLE